MNWKARIKTDPEVDRRRNGVVVILLGTLGVGVCLGMVFWVFMR